MREIINGINIWSFTVCRTRNSNPRPFSLVYWMSRHSKKKKRAEVGEVTSQHATRHTHLACKCCTSCCMPSQGIGAASPLSPSAGSPDHRPAVAQGADQEGRAPHTHAHPASCTLSCHPRSHPAVTSQCCSRRRGWVVCTDTTSAVGLLSLPCALLQVGYRTAPPMFCYRLPFYPLTHPSPFLLGLTSLSPTLFAKSSLPAPPTHASTVRGSREACARLLLTAHDFPLPWRVKDGGARERSYSRLFPQTGWSP